MPVLDVGYETAESVAAKLVVYVDFDVMSVCGKTKIKRPEVGGVTDPATLRPLYAKGEKLVVVEGPKTGKKEQRDVREFWFTWK